VAPGAGGGGASAIIGALEVFGPDQPAERLFVVFRDLASATNSSLPSVVSN
jgi:hypothetical protein